MTDALIAAREAAAPYLKMCGKITDRSVREMLAGEWDNTGYVQHWHRAILAAEARGARRERYDAAVSQPKP